ncbi:MAG: amino acid adenylation domain-containing protein [Bacteroidota bacterium]
MNKKTKLSLAQQDVYYEQIMNPESALYNAGGYITFKGKIDTSQFKTIVEECYKVFDIYNIKFDFAGEEPQQYLKDSSEPVMIDELDVSSASEPEEKALDWMGEQFNIAFDLQEEQLYRFTFIKVAEDKHILYGCFHHLIVDGVGFAVFSNYLIDQYKKFLVGDPLPAPAYPSYLDAIQRSTDYLESEQYNKDAVYWKEKYDVTPDLVLSQKKQKEDRGLSFSVPISEPDSALINRLSKRAEINVSQLTIAVLLVYFGKTTGRKALSFGLPIHKRRGREERKTVGMFSGVLPFKGEFTEDQLLSDVLSNIKQTQRNDFRHGQYPVSHLNRSIKLLSENRLQLFDIIINYILLPFPDHVSSDLNVQIKELRNTTDLGAPLTVRWVDYGQNLPLELNIDYQESYFNEGEIELLIKRLLFILRQFETCLNKPIRDISTIPHTETRQLLEVFNDTAVNYPTEKTVVDLFEEQAAKIPEAIAVVDEGSTLTYEALDQRSTQLAHYLLEQGVASDQLVGICLERGVEMAVGILGILKAGEAYVPIDPDYPQSRIDYMLSDSGVKVVLSSSAAADAFEVREDLNVVLLDSQWNQKIGKLSVNKIERVSSPDNLAYVIYTSGSSGRPKGVMNTHKGILNRLLWTQETYELGSEDVVLQKTTFSFDVSVWELLWPLISGSKLVFARPGGQGDPSYLKNLITSEQVTTIHFVPSMLSVFLSEVTSGDCSSLRRVLCSGEALTLEQVRSFRTLFPKLRLDNLYGPTEAAIDVSSWSLPEDISSLTRVPIGKPVSNTSLYVLDDNENLVPTGVMGELCIGGGQVARGYLNKEDLTREKFVSNPFREGDRLYKTGDLARWLPDGNIEYIGRKDTQVKVRGYRIELGEIENALSLLPEVTQACVLAKADALGANTLIAYVVMNGDSKNTAWKEALQGQLRESLPEYMVPQLWIQLEEMPLTANGKLDRKALPELDGSILSGKEYVAPGTAIEKKLADIWQELLGVEKVGIHDNFFELGGHSLLAVRLISNIQEIGYDISIRDIFSYPSIAVLSTKLSPVQETYQVPENGIKEDCPYITPSMVPLVDLSQEELEKIMDEVPGGGANIQDIYPLAPLQEGIYFHYLMSDSSKGDPYIVSTSLAFSSADKRLAFIEGLRFVCTRHDVLRTCVLSKGLSRAIQVVLRDVDLPVDKLSVDRNKDVSSQVEHVITRENLWVDLSKAPMLRLKIADDPANEKYYLVTHHHHLMMDHVGLEKVQQEIGIYLSGKADQLPTPPLYRDFIGHTLNQYKRIESKEYFSDLYGDISEPTYPFNLSNTKLDGSTCMVSSQVILSAELRDGIRKVSGDLQISPAVLFHAAFGLVIGRCSNSNYALFGSVLLGRLQGSKGSESSLGLFMNTLPVLLNFKGDILSFIEHTNERLQQLISHEQTLLSDVHDWSGIFNDVPMFSALLNYRHSTQNILLETTFDSGLRSFSGEERTNYPFNLSIDDYGNDFVLTAKISNIKVDPSAVVSYMEESLRAILSHINATSTVSIDELSILPKEEKYHLLELFNDTGVAYPSKTLVDLFEEQAAKTPEAFAVVSEELSLSYKELDEHSNQLARYLIDKEVSSEELVGVCLERGLEMIIGILGVLKSGGVYVPIDPTYPKDRIHYMIKDASIKVLLSTTSVVDCISDLGVKELVLLDTASSIIEKESTTPVSVGLSVDHLAYVIYTSGSTGRPKGVQIEHGGICNTIQGQISLFSLSGEDHCLQYASPSFDASIWEIFLSLLSGAKLCIIDESKKYEIDYFIKFVEEQAITFATLPPAFFQLLDISKLSGITTLVTAGEEAPLQNAKLFSRSGNYFNAYGPTEASICATIYNGEIDASVPIGSPVHNTIIYLLNESSALVPIGAVGELCIGGLGLARGYLNQESLTEQQFVANPFREGERLYKTGDLARWLPDGNLEFIGRKDNQVKIRGYRIELGEIENTLSSLSGVSQCCVLAKADGNGNNRLIAYVVADGDLDEAARMESQTESWKAFLQRQLQEHLPEYMVPQLWVQLEDMPLTVGGKLDRKALPEPDSSALSSKEYAGPRTETEEQLVAIWQELLGVEKVGVYDNFFELGGHSLLATRLVATIVKELKVDIMIQDVFNFITIDEMSAYLKYKKAKEEESSDTVYKKTIEI